MSRINYDRDTEDNKRIWAETASKHVKVAGELDKSWSDWLGGIQVIAERQENGVVFTTLTVDASDQYALFGILDRIRDLNIQLLSVTSAHQESAQ